MAPKVRTAAYIAEIFHQQPNGLVLDEIVERVIQNENHPSFNRETPGGYDVVCMDVCYAMGFAEKPFVQQYDVTQKEPFRERLFGADSSKKVQWLFRDGKYWSVAVPDEKRVRIALAAMQERGLENCAEWVQCIFLEDTLHKSPEGVSFGGLLDAFKERYHPKFAHLNGFPDEVELAFCCNMDFAYKPQFEAHDLTRQKQGIILDPLLPPRFLAWTYVNGKYYPSDSSSVALAVRVREMEEIAMRKTLSGQLGSFAKKEGWTTTEYLWEFARGARMNSLYVFGKIPPCQRL